ncbi:uncharacterized protein K02A2.6-like [Homarus americanus]|nr:uncharacterized protein K02A2.6-like [Homarus americanus]
MPQTQQRRTMQLAHETHLGMVKTKALLRGKVWWPTINKDMEKAIRQCIPGASLDTRKQANPVNMSEMKGPWEVIHVDICGPFPSGDYVLGIIDAGSRWPEAFVIKTINTDTVMTLIEGCITTHSIPTVIVSDNGPQFRAKEFAQFCEEWGIKHHKVTPYHPQANGKIERFFATMLKAFRAMHTEGKDWRRQLGKFLMHYKDTPHSMTGETPAKLLMGRNIKVKLPQVSHDLEDTQVTCWDVARKRDKREKEKLKLRTDNRNKSKLAELRPTDQVLLKQTKKDKLSTNYDRKPWTVSERRGDSAILQRGPKKILRSTSQMRRVPGRCQGGNDGRGDSDTDGSHKTAERTDNTHRNRENNQAANTPKTGMDESRQDGNSEEEPLAARRPRRTIVKPKKYQDGAEDFGTDGSESSGTDEVDDSEMDGETSDEYKPGRSWN